MKTVGPFVAARALDTPPRHGAARPVVTLHALDRLTGMPALVYLLPQAVALPDLPDTPSLLPYSEVGVQHGQAYVACELPPHAAQARDPLQTALGGLRALNALHEAGLVHGGVGPAQLWEWNGDVRLGGAGLPWGEAQGALAAPEGGSSPAADLYALGVTLLRMGPLPAGLSDMLSPYPAQRPSARDALARFNAGPPLPPEKTPLIVEAPLRPRSAEGMPTEPPAPAAFPLVADSDERPAEPAPAPLFVQTPPQVPVTQAAREQAESDAAGPVSLPPAAPLLDWDEVQPSEEAAASQPVSAEAVVSGPAPVPAPEPAPVSLVKPGQDAVTAPESLPEVTPPLIFAAKPQVVETRQAQDQQVQAQPAQTQSDEAGPTEPGVQAAPEPVVTTPPAPLPESAPALLAEPARSTVAPPATSAAGTLDAAPSTLGRPPLRRPSPRQLKPVKIGWSQDGSWKAVKEDQAAGGSDLSGSRPGVRPAFNPLWLIGGVGVLLAALLIGRLVSRPVPVASVPGCCTVSSQLVGSNGEALSAPVDIKLVSAPAGSHLQVGALVGQAPGALKLDEPGAYTLTVAADGYAAQQVDLTVPTQEPLKIVLK
jgi:hypothetical protein